VHKFQVVARSHFVKRELVALVQVLPVLYIGVVVV
jgi:hypothetical protein